MSIFVLKSIYIIFTQYHYNIFFTATSLHRNGNIYMVEKEMQVETQKIYLTIVAFHLIIVRLAYNHSKILIVIPKAIYLIWRI